MTTEQPNEVEQAEQKVPQPEPELSQGEPPPVQTAPPISFAATQMGILFKRPKWKVSIFPESVEFTNLDDKEHISITKEEGKNRIEFASAFVSEYNVKFNQGGKEYQFKLASKDLDKLQSWMIPKMASEIASDIKQGLIIRGIGLIAVGIAHFVFSGYLSPMWGGVLIVVGVLSLFITSRYMFLANGLVLILAGIMNCFTLFMAQIQGAGLPGAGFAGVQFIWGLEEIVKFREYGRSQKRVKKNNGT
jgi:hypothetical protein